MKTEKQQLGSNLKEFRLKAELSQEELADISSLHRTYIGSVERGERNISLENIIILSRALKVLPAELLKGIK